MANTLTGLVPTIYEALDIVARELVGFIPACSHDAQAERAALNQTIMIPITGSQTAADNTPAVTSPDTGDQTIGNTTMTISKSKHVPIRWNGEQQLGARSAGWYEQVLRNQFTQAFRTLTNLIEVDLFNAAYQNSSRATGTAGTAPFATGGDISGMANVRRILDDNGAPQTDLKLVLGSAAVANLRGKQTLLLRLNESGSGELLRNGSISALPVDGFDLYNSAAVAQVTKGTGASFVTSGSSAAGTNAVVLVTGTGTVLAGDVVTFAADANNAYVNTFGISGPGTIQLGSPGLEVVIPTGNALTVGGSYTPNIAFHKQALQLVTRLPAMPLGMDGSPQDLAEDLVTVTDPVSGLSFEIVMYRQFRQLVFHCAIAWGVAAIKPNYIATLVG